VAGIADARSSAGASLIAGYLAHAEFHLSGGHGVEA
jgi:hypothetical protein